MKGCGSLHGYHLFGLHFLLFCPHSGLSCWVGIAPETHAHSMFCTVLCPFPHFFCVCCRYMFVVLCVLLSCFYWLSYFDLGKFLLYSLMYLDILVNEY